MSENRIHPVTKSRHCEVCDGDHKCGYKDDGLILCGRRQGEQPGFRWLGECKNNPTWHLYRRDGDPRDSGPIWYETRMLRPHLYETKAQRGDDRDWGLIARQLTEHLSNEGRQALVEQLRVPAYSFDELTVGWNDADRSGGCWTFPERDGRGRVVGIMRRFPDGQQRAQAGGQRGLFIPRTWQNAVGPLFLVEGASDTLAMTALGLAVVGRPSCTGGVEFLAELLRSVPADRVAIVVGENDARATPHGTLWPGRDGAQQTALELQQRLQRPVLWTLPPHDAKDVRAWALARNLPIEGGTTMCETWARAGFHLSQLLEQAARSPLAGQDGVPLALDVGEVDPPFPLEVLPAALRTFVVEAARAVGCSEAFVAVPLLAAAGAALGNAWELAVTATHVQSAALFTLVVGHPGSGKSPAFQLVTAPLRQLEQEAVAQHQEALQRWLALPDDLRHTPPQCPRLLLDDFTTEALAPLLEHNPKGLLVIKDELAGLINALNQYRGGKGHDRQVLLSLWAGADLVIDRKSQKEKGPILVRRPFVSIAGGIQPAVLERLRGTDKRPVADDGLLDRFLFAFPEPRPVRGEDWSVLSAETAVAWQQTVERLHRELPLGLPAAEEASTPFPLPLAVQRIVNAGQEREPWQPRRLVLSEAARERWQAFTTRLAEQASAEDFPECLQGVWSKLRGYGARLALVLEALYWANEPTEPANRRRKSPGQRPPSEVSAAAVDGAAQLVEWFQHQARKVHELLATNVRRKEAERVLRWLVERPEVQSFTRRDVYQSLRRTFLRPAALDAPLQLLAEHRYVVALRQGTTLRYQVNPLWQPRQV